MKTRIFSIFCIAALFLSFSFPAGAAGFRISAAASLAAAVQELIGIYQHQHPDIEILPNFASSGSLARQIETGAPADVFVSANPKWMDYLESRGLISGQSVRPLVGNQLVFVGFPVDNVRSLDDLVGLDRVALGSPKSTPVGRYAEQAMTAAGIYQQLKATGKLIFAKDVFQALIYAERQEVDGAFIYQTDALLAKQAKILFTVPQKFYPQVVYPAALTEDGISNPAARNFLDYLSSAEAKLIFAQYGFETDD